MASQRPLLPHSGRLGLLARAHRPQSKPVCLLCSLGPATANRARPGPRRDVTSQRYQSTTTKTANPRVELEQTLEQLQKQAPSLVNLSRLQLAIQGLRQEPGREAVRVAILGLANASESGQTARTILRLLLADPLKDEEAWEKDIEHHDPSMPLIVRVGRADNQTGDSTITSANPLQEIRISSAELNGLDLELLLMDVNPPPVSPGDGSIQSTEDALLVPVVDVPSAENRSTPITTPVHKTILVTDGLMGAVQVSALPLLDSKDCILPAVNMEGIPTTGLDADFNIVDINLAAQAIQRFRQGPQYGMEYERLWFASNLPALTSWLKSGIKTSEGTTKPAVRKLIASLLQSTLAAIQAGESRKLSQDLETAFSSPSSAPLNTALANWAQKAHAELQDELDLAFTGRRWRKLGWWKLFWRVDDVAMLTNEMLSQRFLPTAEQELVYLTGRIAELGGDPSRYTQPKRSAGVAENGSEMRRLGSGELAPMVSATTATSLPKWPGHIAFTRRYLQNETVPALQALAQKLVVQSIGTTSIAGSLAALLYVSSLASTLYEAGAFAALGLVLALGRMQKKWETARDFWEGEVREEGRKAVRGAETSVQEALDGGKLSDLADGKADELDQARELVAKAEDALARMK